MIRAALLALALAGSAAAQDLPDWQHTSINDFATLLSAEDTQVLDRALIALHEETGVEGTVVTLTDRARYGGAPLEPFATRLFNHWGVGDAARNDGFMVLVIRDDREARVELGAGYGPEADIIAQDIMRATMLPDFRAGHLSHGIREGTLDVIQHIARPHAAGHELTVPRRSLIDRIIPVAFFGFFGFVLVQIARGWWQKFRRYRQPCPNCGGSGLVQQSEVITDSLPGGAGTARQVTWARCPRCGWTGNRSEPMPVTQRRRHSRGFGGGRSSGGGASGRW